jgi:hypothetical protein
MATPYRRVEYVVELTGWSIRTIQDRAAKGTIPHRRIGGTRPLLFLEHELRAWVDGAELEIIKTPNGGRIVRPKAPA